MKKHWDDEEGVCKSAVCTSPLWGDVIRTARTGERTEAVCAILKEALRLKRCRGQRRDE